MQGQITIFAKVGCKPCERACALLQPMYTNTKVVYINPAKKPFLLRLMGLLQGDPVTMPQIFFNAHHVGDSSYVIAKNADGMLEDLMSQYLSYSFDVAMVKAGPDVTEWFEECLEI